MKNALLLLYLFFSANFLIAKSTVIDNPAYEFTKSGIVHVSKIELGNKETRVHIHTIFIPGWWVKFDLYPFIEDAETGKKWNAIRMENGEFDKEISMPSSGDSTFVLIFPPIDKKKVQRINYGEKDETIVFGISLNPKEKQKSREVPLKVEEWINNELASAKIKTPMDLDAGKFFKRETTRIIGYINGYKPQSGFKTGIIYLGNELTREDYPTVIEIHEDGRFECDFSLCYPQYNYFALNDKIIYFYIEPGQTLAIRLDWEEFLLADRYRNINYKFKNIQFGGPLAQINKELSEAMLQITPIDFGDIYNNGFQLEPDKFIPYIESKTSTYVQDIENILANNSYHPTTNRILYINRIIEKPKWLLDYEMRYSREDGKEKLPLSFYDFLHDMPLDTPHLLLAKEFSTFINRFEYCDPLCDAYRLNRPVFREPEKTFEEYLFEELKLNKSKEFEEFLNYEKQLFENEKSSVSDEDLSEHKKMAEKFKEIYSSQLDEYTKKYIDPLKKLNPTNEERELRFMQLRDSIYKETLQLPPSFTYEVSKIRELKNKFESSLNREESRSYLNKLSHDISHPFLKSEAERVYNSCFPINEKEAYELPIEQKGTEIFKNIIDPHKGKYLFVDFWATSCGPCIHGIKNMKETRAFYKDNPDIAFVFITSENESPENKYSEFINEQELVHTHRISKDDYLYLRQLFKFNGIPRYVLVNREGKIMDDNFSIYSFERVVEDLLKK